MFYLSSFNNLDRRMNLHLNLVKVLFKNAIHGIQFSLSVLFGFYYSGDAAVAKTLLL